MVKLISAALLSGLCAAVATAPPRTYATENAASALAPVSRNEESAGHAIKIVPFLELLIRPERYVGETIRVSGYLLNEYPDARLFISRDDRTALGAFFGAVDINFRSHKIPVDYDRLRANERRGYFIVRGRFTMAGPDHAMIDEISDYTFALDGPEEKRP